MNYKSLTQSEKNSLAKQYEPLVNKITKQFVERVKVSWDDVKSMAWEGFALAIEQYDDTKSKMNFTQYAGFAIRNNILTSLDNELRVVKLSNYAQKKAIEKGEAVFNSVSIDTSVSPDDDVKPREIVMGMYQEEKFSDGDTFNYLYSRLENDLCERDYTIFYMAFGLKDYDETKGKDIASFFNISEGLVSQRLKKVIEYIRKDNDLCEMLTNLLK